MSYAGDVGSRLRQLRAQQGLSLQDVERKSNGEWKAAVVGSYERGDRNISAARLCELAEFYGVSPSELLPTDETPRQMGVPASMMIDLQTLLRQNGDWDGVRRYVESIQVQRGDYNQKVLSIRAEDVRAMAIMMGTTPEGYLELLRIAGVLIG